MTLESTAGAAQPARATEVLTGLLSELSALAGEQAQRAAQRRAEARRPRKGATLRPGDETPLWNAVAEKMRPHLRVRGAKSDLARVLGVPSQRVHEYFVAGTQLPNAERMLHILLWLADRENEGPAGTSAQPPR